MESIAVKYPQTPYAEAFHTFKQFRTECIKSLLKVNHDLTNIEDVFGILDIATLVHGNDSPYSQVYSQCERLISDTIVASQRLKVSASTDRSITVRTDGYGGTIERIRTIIKYHKDAKITIITTNYDVALDLTLLSAGLITKNGASRLVLESDDGRITLVKLHGSVAVGIDSLKKHLDRLGDALARRRMIGETSLRFRPTSLTQGRASEDLIIFDPNDYSIMPPVGDKRSDDPMYSSAWMTAHKAIADAGWLYFCGYSLPASDSYIRKFLAFSLHDNFSLRKLGVIDPSLETRDRFKKCLGAEFSNTGRLDIVDAPGTYAPGLEFPNAQFHAWHSIESFLGVRLRSD